MTTPTDRGTRTVLVFSQDPAVREGVRTAVGRRPARDIGRVVYVECSTGDQVIRRIDAGGVDLAILDGEARPTGGMGICRQLKHEVTDCPPICVLVARPDDRWLATWSLADDTIAWPRDAVNAGEIVAALLRTGTPAPAPR